MAGDLRFSAQFQQPFAEQIAFFLQKLNLPTERYDDITRGAHDRGFVVAGAAKADLLDDLRRSVEGGIRAGSGLDKFRRDFRALVERNGWHGWTGEGTKKGEAWRTRVIYETNLRASYAAARYQQMKNPDLLNVAPYWQYVHSGKEHYRPEHKAWSDERLTLWHDHPFWQTHYPPNGYGCGCTVTAVVAPRRGAATEPPDGWNVPNPKTGTPPGIDPGWDHAPGANTTTPLVDLAEQKLVKLDSAIGAQMWEAIAPAIEMERELKWFGTLDKWLSDPVPRGRCAIVGALSPKIVTALSAGKLPVPASAEIAIEDRLVIGRKQTRHKVAGDALTNAEWRRLPQMITAGKADGRVFHDAKNGKLVFVADDTSSATKIVVEFNPKKTGKRAMNMIDTAFRVKTVDVEASIKGGEWVPL